MPLSMQFSNLPQWVQAVESPRWKGVFCVHRSNGAGYLNVHQNGRSSFVFEGAKIPGDKFEYLEHLALLVSGQPKKEAKACMNLFAVHFVVAFIVFIAG